MKRTLLTLLFLTLWLPAISGASCPDYLDVNKRTLGSGPDLVRSNEAHL